MNFEYDNATGGLTFSSATFARMRQQYRMHLFPLGLGI
jgi:hypothetical protein